MAMSGVVLNDEALEIYKNQMKLNPTLQCIMLKFSEDAKEIIVDETFKKGKLDFEDMKKMLPEQEGRYLLYDMEYTTKAGQNHNKIVFIAWSPDVARIKNKMMMAASKDALKNKLEAIALEVQAVDLGDLDKAEIQERLRNR